MRALPSRFFVLRSCLASLLACAGVVVVAVVAPGCDLLGFEGESDGDGQEGEGEEGEGEAGKGLAEEEPNNGDPVTQVNVLPVGTGITGVVDGADDVDFFHLEGTIAGHAYIALALDVGRGDVSALRVAVLDDGRGGDAPGNDYVRLGGGHASFVVLGGGVFVAVDDQNGDGGGYDLIVEDITVDLSGATIVDSVSGTLDAASSIGIYGFDADAGSDVVFDLDTAGDGDFRLFVVSLSTGDWIARNDDRAIDDVDPLIDAPLFEDGPYFLLVENNEQTATALTYTITATLP